MSEPIYGSLDEAGWQSAQEEIDSAQYSGQRSWKPKIAPAGSQPALNRIRFMPPHKNMVDPKGKLRPFVHVRVHFSLGPNHNVSAPCLKQWGETCRACDDREAFYARIRQLEGDPANLGEIEKLKKRGSDTRAQDRFSSNIIDMQDPDKGVQPYHFGPDLAKAFSACFYDDEGKFRDITHPQTGRDILFTGVKKPKSGNMKVEPNDYPSCRPAEKPSALPKMEWLNDIQDMSVYAKRITADDMRKVIEEGVRLRQGTGPTTRAEASPVSTPTIPSTPPPAADVPRVPPKRGKKGARAQVPDEAPSNGDPWAKGRAWLHTKGFTEYKPLTLEELADLKGKEPMKSGQLTCFEKETDPNGEIDPVNKEYCRSCRVVLACATGLVGSPEAMAARDALVASAK